MNEIQPHNQFIQIDDKVVNLAFLCAISQIDSDYDGHTRLYFTNGDEIDFPKPYKETSAYLALKNINITSINEEEGVVLPLIQNIEIDEDLAEFIYSTGGDSICFEHNGVEELQKALGSPEVFNVENIEDDVDDEDDEVIVEEIEESYFDDFESEIEETKPVVKEHKISLPKVSKTSTPKSDHRGMSVTQMVGYGIAIACIILVASYIFS